MDHACEYERCGGTGRRITSAAVRREAHIVVTIAGHVWRVCESCADLLIRDMTAQGYELLDKHLVVRSPTPQQPGRATPLDQRVHPKRQKRRGRKWGLAQKQARRALAKVRRRFLPQETGTRSFESIANEVNRRLKADGTLRE